MNLRWTAAAGVVTVTAIGAAIGVAVASTEPTAPADRPATVGPQDQTFAATEDARPSSGRVRDVTLAAAPAQVRVGGRRVKTWAFNGKVPGPQIRVRVGDVLQARVVNNLPAPLTVHWHGVALRNDMDGVPDVTQTAIAPGATFTYRFKVSDAGTFFYHPHVGTELDRGLYGALIVDPARTDRSTARDITLLLDDWIDGTGKNPDDVLDQLKNGMGNMGQGSSGAGSGMPDMPGMSDMPGMGSAKSPLGSDIEDVTYPSYVLNGRAANDPATYKVRPDERVRLRLVNAASNTPFRVAAGGDRRLTVVASDGYAVKPVTVDTLLIGMGERYDVLVTAPKSGSMPIVARAEGLDKQALAVLRAGPGPAPRADVKPMALSGTLLRYSQLKATGSDALPERQPDRTYTVKLSGDMQTYNWGITTPTQDSVTLPVHYGERVRLVLDNPTKMWHPIHLHGHTFQLVSGRAPGARKDTVDIPPMSRVTVDVQADNPGQWALHCHNIYHAEAGMATVLSYVK